MTFLGISRSSSEAYFADLTSKIKAVMNMMSACFVLLENMTENVVQSIKKMKSKKKRYCLQRRSTNEY